MPIRPIAAAEPVDQQLKAVRQTLRQAQRDMFAGRSDRAMAALGNLAQTLRQLKAAAPDHPQVQQAERKFAKLVKDLERRTGKDLGAGTLTAAPEKRTADAPAQVSADTRQMVDDIQDLEERYQQVRPVFDHASRAPRLYADLKSAANLLAEIETFESRDKAALETVWRSFGAKYGTRAEVIDARAEEAGYQGVNKASFAYSEIAAGFRSVSAARGAMAEHLSAKASRLLDQTDRRINDLRRMRLFEMADAYSRLAIRYNPANPRAAEQAAHLKARTETNRKTMLARVDHADWPGTADNAPVLSKADHRAIQSTVQQAADRLAAEENSRARILAIAVAGPWSAVEYNLLKEPVQFALPVRVAMQLTDERRWDLVRVYEMDLLTELRRGIQPAPPFFNTRVHTSTYIRPSAVGRSR